MTLNILQAQFVNFLNFTRFLSTGMLKFLNIPNSKCEIYKLTLINVTMQARVLCQVFLHHSQVLVSPKMLTFEDVSKSEI